MKIHFWPLFFAILLLFFSWRRWRLLQKLKAISEKLAGLVVQHGASNATLEGVQQSRKYFSPVLHDYDSRHWPPAEECLRALQVLRRREKELINAEIRKALNRNYKTK